MAMIRLFSAGETNFDSNGDHVIKPIKLVETKKKSLNGWSIEVQLPIKYKNLIEQDMLCVVKSKSKLKPQAFRINNPKHTSRVVTFTANHVMFDAERYFLLDVRPTNLSAISALNYIDQRTEDTSPFSYISNVNKINTAYFIRKNLLEAWKVLEERWNGIFDADNFEINFKIDASVDKGATLNYGVDLQGVEVIEDWSSVVTKLFPVGSDGLMLPEKQLVSEIQYAKPYVRTVQFESDLLSNDSNEDISEADLIEELREKASAYLETNEVPRVSYTIKSDVRQDLAIGDLVVVKHPYVSLNTQVQEYRFDVLKNRVISLVFGNYNRDVKKIFDDVKDTIQDNKNKLSNVERLVADQTNLINGLNKSGYVYIDDNEILILDILPKEDAENLWRIGLGGLGFSSNGYEGPYEYAFTQDGKFNASFIAAGAITTNMLDSDVGSSLDISSNESIGLIVKNIKNIETTPGPPGENAPPLVITDQTTLPNGDVEITFSDGSKVTVPKGEDGDSADPLTIVNQIVDASGNTVLTFSDGSVVTVQKGQDGTSGNGIESYAIHYVLSTGGQTPPTTGWSTSMPSLTKGRYLWTRTTTSFKEGDDSVSYSVSYIPTDGEAGVGIETTAVTYQIGDSGTTKPTGTWVNNPPTPVKGKYLWTKNTFTYTDESVIETFSVSYYPLDGAQGTGVTTTEIKYQVGNDGVTVPTGTWVNNPPTPVKGKYLWTRTVIEYSDQTTSTAYSTSYWATDGAKGDEGRSLASIALEFYLSNSKTSQTGGSWSTTQPTWIPGKYLWKRNKWTYQNPTSVAYSTPEVDSTWEAVNEIQVGGRNYLLNSNDLSNVFGPYSGSLITWSDVDTGDDWGEPISQRAVITGGTHDIMMLFSTDNTNSEPMGHNEHWTISFWFKNQGENNVRITLNGLMETPSIPLIEPNETVRIERTGIRRELYDWFQVLVRNETSNIGEPLDVIVGRMKIEKGNVATDWTPAPEDVNAEISDQVAAVEQSFSTSLNLLKDEVLTQVSESYTKQTDLTSYKQELATILSQTALGWDFQFENITQEMINLNGATQEEINEFKAMIRMVAGDIHLSKENSRLKVIISNEKMSFTDNGQEVAYISNNMLYITNATILNQLRIGAFAYTPRQNGSLSFGKRGE